ncbi:MAG: efflux transporter periplasmic adaptor subunit [Thalassobius sp.]|nr:efflux transporter periplasmic adaptor subunit [Thalassovita sp.]
MKNIIYSILFLLVTSCFSACSNHNEGADQHEEEAAHEEHEGEHEENEVHFSKQQFNLLEMKVDTLPMRNISNYVQANGQLNVPPEKEAVVTAIIGGNLTSIKIIPGDKVREGEVLATMSHPDLIKLQSDYINQWNQLEYLEQEYKRQEKLFAEKVGAEREYQKIKADYQSLKGEVKGYEAQLKLLHLNLEKIRKSEIYEQIPLVSPIDGYVQQVKVRKGQYVSPQTELFELVNIEHIHLDLKVFEKDVYKVKNKQKVNFTIQALPNKTLQATIFSVGKAFETEPKAVGIHAEIENTEGLLLPGMYVRGKIQTEDARVFALPEDGVIREGSRYFIFNVQQESDEWKFEPVEVLTGKADEGWVEVKPLNPLDKNMQFAWNNAYYIMAEMKKGEAEHSH